MLNFLLGICVLFYLLRKGIGDYGFLMLLNLVLCVYRILNIYGKILNDGGFVKFCCNLLFVYGYSKICNVLWFDKNNIEVYC